MKKGDGEHKSVSAKKTEVHVHHHKHSDTHENHEGRHESIESKLIENFVSLQKVNADLAEKLDKLANEISGLLKLFEMTARNFADHPAVQASDKDKEFLDKIDKLLDQNKTIAKGLTMMEDRMREKIYGSPAQVQRPMEDKAAFNFTPTGKPLPRF